MSPRPITEAVGAAVADATDLDADDDDASLTFTVEGHDVTIDGGGHVSVDPAE